MLIALPIPFVGGDLIVKDTEQDHRFQWSQLGDSELGWAFLYADKDHEILPVKQGYRLVIQYQVDGGQELPELRAIALPKDNSATYKVIESMLQDPLFRPEGGSLAIGLKHLYALPTRDARLKKYWSRSHDHLTLVSNDRKETQAHLLANLKGDDLLLYQTFLALGCMPSAATAFDPAKLEIDKDHYKREGHPEDSRSSWVKGTRNFDAIQFRYISKDLRIFTDSQNEYQAYSEGYSEVSGSDSRTRSFGLEVDASFICEEERFRKKN